MPPYSTPLSRSSPTPTEARFEESFAFAAHPSLRAELEVSVGDRWAVVIGVSNYADERVADLGYAHPCWVEDGENTTRTYCDGLNRTWPLTVVLSDERSPEGEGS
jgi:hypothetical protein